MESYSYEATSIPIRVRRKILVRGEGTYSETRVPVRIFGLPARKEPRGNRFGHFFQVFLVVSVMGSLIVGVAARKIFASAFEAHVINVTAQIEMPPGQQCEVFSLEYWNAHDGCNNGFGSSDWTSRINDLSLLFSGVFRSSTGPQICKDVWIPDCASENEAKANLCEAKAHVLADELNVVSGRLRLDALLAGADDGSEAFDALGLEAGSTVGEALETIEKIIGDESSSDALITDGAYIAERIHTFYEFENPFNPQCILDLQRFIQEILDRYIRQNPLLPWNQENQGDSLEQQKVQEENAPTSEQEQSAQEIINIQEVVSEANEQQGSMVHGNEGNEEEGAVVEEEQSLMEENGANQGNSLQETNGNNGEIENVSNDEELNSSLAEENLAQESPVPHEESSEIEQAQEEELPVAQPSNEIEHNVESLPEVGEDPSEGDSVEQQNL